MPPRVAASLGGRAYTRAAPRARAKRSRFTWHDPHPIATLGVKDHLLTQYEALAFALLAFALTVLVPHAAINVAVVVARLDHPAQRRLRCARREIAGQLQGRRQPL